VYLNGKLLEQFFNMYSNKKKDREMITLEFIEDQVFYLALDKEIQKVRPVKITFSNERLNEGSMLLNKIANCVNGKSTTLRLFDIFKLYKIYSTLDIDALIDLLEKQNQEIIYTMYTANYEYDKNIKAYNIILIPPDKENPIFPGALA